MIDIRDKERCCGCGACAQACPVQCISMRHDEEGFPYPAVDTARCTGCGLCERICPYNRPLTPRRPQRIAAFTNPDETVRMSSSSGGLFTALAEGVLARSGRVFGATFDSDWSVCHTSVAERGELVRLRGSKYVQSDTRRTFAEARSLLKEGREVLYTGTPCQIAGLRSFLGREYDNLLLVDFTCHGVPSPGLWQKYLRERLDALFPGERRGPEAIDRISFRDKRHGWRRYSLTLCADGREASATRYEDAWLRGFLADLYLRPSCHSCAFRRFTGGSDLTISDFWNIPKYLPETDEHRRSGVSLAYVHTGKGSAAIERSGCDATPLGRYAYPPMIYRPTDPSPYRRSFFEGIRRGERLHTLVDRLARLPRWRRKLRSLRQKLRKLTFSHEDRYFDPTAPL